MKLIYKNIIHAKESHIKCFFFIVSISFSFASIIAQGLNTNAIKLSNAGQNLTLQPAAGMLSSYSLTLPTTLPSSNNQVITSSTAGVTVWTIPSTVSSIGIALPSVFTVSSNPVTGNGTISVTLANQNANTVFAAPSSGVAAAPAFRALTATDIPTHTHTINNISTFSFTNLTSGDILQYNGTNYVNTKPSNLYAATGMNLKFNTITASYNATNSDFTIFCNINSNITVTLPDAVSNKGQILFIIINSGYNNYSVTIQPSNSQQIDDAASYKLGGGAPYRGQTLQSDGTNWYFIPTF